ncbi:MAG: Sec-independent protein translocase protein TatB [Gammaproteobacteria bacterium]|jgi:sec-independent protein translocase protein TatB
MFDIGFWELLIIGVVALLVIGPERLPKVARTAGLWLGRARRFVSSVKADIDREIAAEELKKVLAKQAESTGLHDIIEETRQSIEPGDTGKTGSRESTDAGPAGTEGSDEASEEIASHKSEKPSSASTDRSNDASG